MAEREITKEVFRELNKIKETFGIKAFDELMKIYFKLTMRIEDLEKSRAKWREKYEQKKI